MSRPIHLTQTASVLHIDHLTRQSGTALNPASGVQLPTPLCHQRPGARLVHDAHEVVDVLLPVASLATLDKVLPLHVKAACKPRQHSEPMS